MRTLDRWWAEGYPVLCILHEKGDCQAGDSGVSNPGLSSLTAEKGKSRRRELKKWTDWAVEERL